MAQKAADPAKRPPLDGRALSVITYLRWADTQLPVSAGLASFGAAFLLYGSYALFSAHPWLACFFFALLCFLAAALAHHGGLVTFLPTMLQNLLLRTTPFDLLFDNAEFINFRRCWGRMLLLCTQPAEGEIQTILQGLDRDFLDRVLRKGLVHMLPKVPRQLLLPGEEAYEKGCWANSLGALMLKYAKAPPRGRFDARQLDLTPAGIHALLCRKEEEQQLLATHPALTPVLRALLPEALLPVRHLARQSLQAAVVASTAAAAAWAASALLFCTPGLQRRAAACLPAAAGGSRVAKVAAGLSVLGAGASLAFGWHVRRYWLPKVRPNVVGNGETSM